MDDGTECCICSDRFTTFRPRYALNCNHEFHRECIIKWSKIRNHCPVCERAISLKDDIACYGREKRPSHGNAAETSSSKKPRSSASKAVKGGPKHSKTTTEPRSRGRSSHTHSKADASQDKARDQKSAKGNISMEEETLRYYPEWDVHPTDHPSDPLVARNLAEGIILPIQAADFADMHTDLLHEGAYKYNTLALNFSTASLIRATEEKAAAERKLLQKEAEVSDLTEQLDTVLARVLHAESRVRQLEEEALLISELKKAAESAEARAVAAEMALKNVKDEAARKVAEVSSKVNEALLSFIR